MICRQRIVIGLLITILLAGMNRGSLAFAQDEGAVLEITRVDTTAFPDIVLDLFALDESRTVVSDYSGLAIQEDGAPVTNTAREQISVGIDVFYIIDANRTIEQRDEPGGLSRREKVRDSIVSYAREFMASEQADRVSIVVPDGAGARFLDSPGLTFTNEVINAINFYETGPPADSPLQAMFELALEEAERSLDASRKQIFLLFTDGAEIGSQLDYDALLDSARRLGLVIHGAILGRQADPGEIDNVSALTDPTGGSYVHLEEPADAHPLYEAMRAWGNRERIQFRSGLNSSGMHTIVAELGTSRAETTVDLVIDPPSVEIQVDNSRPIRRVATSADGALEEVEPTQQPLVASVSWPDNQPRELVAAALLVNGVEVPLDPPALDDNNLVEFIWDIRALEQGAYELQFQVTDELGLQGMSQPLALTIVVERPAPTAPPPTAIPTAAPVPTTVEPPERASTPLGGISQNTILLVVALLALFALAILALLAIFILRRRRRDAPRPVPQVAAPHRRPAAPRQPAGDSTLVIPPEFALEEATGAYMEPLENAPEHQGAIPLIGANISFGRDPNKVQIPFNDRSVSRLHARIVESNGTYRIYDEGSTSGTYLNYERIGLTPHALKDADEIHFGRVHLRFRLASST